VKHGLKREIIYRGLYAVALLSVSVGVIALAAMSIQVPVSAGQAAAQTAGPSATTDNSPTHPEFPEGEGRDAVLRLCVKCHSPNIILANGQDRTGWENTITKMVRLGATGDDEDFSDIADYLTKHFPPSPVLKIFVNMATDKQFATILGISDDEAKAIVAYRDKVKGFKTIDDMKKVPNIDAAKLDAKKANLIF
jgi:competence protein ComEA